MKRILECVPNFSEGRDRAVIDAICEPIKNIPGVQLLDVDPGASTNRTVVTFAGEPEAVIEAAFQAIKVAAHTINMQQHSGAHPRMGATDVCPLIPVSGITTEEAVALAHILAKRVAEELDIPVYMYEQAATSPDRRNLSIIRQGEYEGFATKITDPQWAPDYGKPVFNAKSGQTVIGVREFLAAVNFNLNTQSVRLANSVAFDVRENGRVKTDTGKPSGKPLLDAKGEPLRIPGTLTECKGIGWYMEEYGFAQVSMNLTNLNITPLHRAFEEVEKSAFHRGLRVTGTEIVGMLPLSALTDAGKYFLAKQGRSTGVSEAELVQCAIHTMGLSEIKTFKPEEKIIEYKLQNAVPTLASMSITEFSRVLASDAPAPGGGSVAALCGTMAAALTAMTANLAAGKKGREDELHFFSDIAEKAQYLRAQLLFLIDEDTRAFQKVMEAYGLPKSNETEKSARTQAINSANLYAAEVPLRVMQTAMEIYPLLHTMIDKGNASSITDAGVGVLCANTCIEGAGMNVQINIAGIHNEADKSRLQQSIQALLADSEKNKNTLVQKVYTQIQ